MADPTTQRIEGPTPGGGAYAVAAYRDAAGDPAPKSRATRVEITEFDADGQAVARTYGTLSPPAEPTDADIMARVARYLGIRLHQPPTETEPDP